jgi:hypothetical protein
MTIGVTADSALAAACTYRVRFTVGFTPGRDYRYIETNRFLRQLHPEIVAQTEKKIADLGGAVLRDPATDLLTVNNEFTACLVLARCQTHENRRNHWKVRFDTSLLPDITVAVRCGGARLLPAATPRFWSASYPARRSEFDRIRELSLRHAGLSLRHG